MKNIRHLLFIVIISLLLPYLLAAQTNTFPSTGNVGIGTTTPGYYLDIGGGTTVQSRIQLQRGSDDYYQNMLLGWGGIVLTRSNVPLSSSQTTFSITQRGSDGDRVPFYINALGNVGIGTINPSSKLHIDGQGGTDPVFYITRNTPNSLGGQIYFSPAFDAGAQGNIITTNYYGDPNQGTLTLNAYGRSSQLVVHKSGYLGIGTSSPTAPLEAIGSLVRFSTAALGSSGDILEFSLGTTLQIGTNYYGGSSGYKPLTFASGGYERMRVSANGNVGIGTLNPSEKLSVNGNIRTQKLIVTQTGWSDYVFGDAYKLRSLPELEMFIKQNKHLPEMPTAKEVEEKGISVGDNQALLLRKIEELTLYMIDLKRENQKQQKEIDCLKKKRNAK